jgi:hypothetical protein
MFLCGAGYNLPVQTSRNHPLCNLPLRHQLCAGHVDGLYPEERFYWSLVQSSSIQSQGACRHSDHVLDCRSFRHGGRSHCGPAFVVYKDSERSSVHLLDLLISGTGIWNCWLDAKNRCVSNQGKPTSAEFVKIGC